MPSVFAQWLRLQREARGLSMNALAQKAGIKSHVHISMLEAGKANPSRPMVRRLARALELNEIATGEGLVAAGFVPGDDSQPPSAIRYVTDPDALAIVEAYEGASPTNRQLLRSLADEIRRIEEDHSIGKRKNEDRPAAASE